MLKCEVCRENGQEGKITSNLGMDPTDSCWGQEAMNLSCISLPSSCTKANKTVFWAPQGFCGCSMDSWRIQTYLVSVYSTILAHSSHHRGYKMTVLSSGTWILSSSRKEVIRKNGIFYGWKKKIFLEINRRPQFMSHCSKQYQISMFTIKEDSRTGALEFLFSFQRITASNKIRVLLVKKKRRAW